MTNVPADTDQAVELLQKLSLDESKPFEVQVADNANKCSSANSCVLANGLNKPFERSTTPRQHFLDPNAYIPSAYPTPICYGGGEWDDYSYASNGVDASSVAYNSNGSVVYPQGYSFTPYGPYHPPGSPVPTIGHEGQIYGHQHYQYPSYYQSSAPTNGSYAPTQANPQQAGLTAPVGSDQVPVPLESIKVNSNVTNAGINSISVPKLHRSNYQSSRLLHTPAYSDGKSKHPGSHGNNFFNGRNPNLFTFSPLTQPRPNFGMNQVGCERMYPNNRLYGQYGNIYRTGSEYGIPSYDRRIYGYGSIGGDNRYKPRGRANGSYAPGSVYDGLNELNRGPRAKGFKNLKDVEPANVAMKDPQIELGTVLSNEKKPSEFDMDQFNKEDFPEHYEVAKFFIIKSYSEDDVHKSIKYGSWASTPNGNKKLDAAYQEAQEVVAGGCPVFLFFSVNGSGQFVGVAEMLSAVDFDKSVEYWQQDKWTGYFPVKWHIVKDIPNSLLKHIVLSNNEDKPVTNSRDTQEVPLEQGIEMLKIFKGHSSKTCMGDDFGFYEARQKIIQEKKAKQINKEVGTSKITRVAIDDNERNSLDDVASPILVEDHLTAALEVGNGN